MSKDDKETMLGIYRVMVRIRRFEETFRHLVLSGSLISSGHLYIGEEAIAAGVCSCLRNSDAITSTHRGHGHCIAKGADTKLMMAELYSKATGYCKGKGGSMHIADVSKGIYGANGIVAAGIPIATGIAFAQKYKGEDNATVAFFGDGASNRGVFHESINMAASQNLPIVFACENNNYAMATAFPYHSRNKTISQRSAAYDIPGKTVDGNDAAAVREAALEAVDLARSGGGPSLLEFVTWRHTGHFMSDKQLYKDPDEQERWIALDPIPRFEKYLLESGFAEQAEIDQIKAEAADEIEEAVKFAEESPEPEYDTLFEDLFV